VKNILRGKYGIEKSKKKKKMINIKSKNNKNTKNVRCVGEGEVVYYIPIITLPYPIFSYLMQSISSPPSTENLLMTPIR
jgi:hypothetical protein